MQTAVIVGRGIIGATIARALQLQGVKVTVIDREEKLAGTAASGGHLKPSWFGGLKKEEYEPAMELLDQCWGLHSSEFSIRPGGLKTTVYRVDTDQVLQQPYMPGFVVRLLKEGEQPGVVVEKPTGTTCVVRADLVVVAAGVWCSELFDIPIQRKQGVSFRFSGRLKQEFIDAWAPYKQIVAHQQSEQEIWIGDGSAILQQNWTEQREQDCLARCQKRLAPTHKLIRKITGLRPYCETGKDPCYFHQPSKNVFVVTGAGKSGTIAAGWAARRILNACFG